MFYEVIKKYLFYACYQGTTHCGLPFLWNLFQVQCVLEVYLQEYVREKIELHTFEPVCNRVETKTTQTLPLYYQNI